jgi:hypothetical protein
MLGIKLLLAEHTWTGYAEAFALIERERADALLVSATTTNYGNRRLIVEFAAKTRLPTIYPFREAVEVGGLMSYGASIPDLSERGRAIPLRDSCTAAMHILTRSLRRRGPAATTAL